MLYLDQSTACCNYGRFKGEIRKVRDHSEKGRKAILTEEIRIHLRPESKKNPGIVFPIGTILILNYKLIENDLYSFTFPYRHCCISFPLYKESFEFIS
jgi:hypothetical protein